MIPVLLLLFWLCFFFLKNCLYPLSVAVASQPLPFGHCPLAVARHRCPSTLSIIAHHRCQSPIAVACRLLPVGCCLSAISWKCGNAIGHCPLSIARWPLPITVACWPLPVTVARHHCPSTLSIIAHHCCPSAVACQPFPGSVGMLLIFLWLSIYRNI